MGNEKVNSSLDNKSKKSNLNVITSIQKGNSVENNHDNKQDVNYKKSKIKKEFILEGLGCANCASKMETNLNKLEGVNSAYINFMTKTLVMELEEIKNTEELIAAAKEIVTKIESNVVVKEKVSKKAQKKVLSLKGLCCANCADKIERQCGKINGVKSALVDFTSQRLILEVDGMKEWNRIFEEAKKIINNIESHVIVSEEKRSSGQGHSHSHENQHDHHDHGHEHEHGGDIDKKELIRFGVGAGIFAVAVGFKMPFPIELSLFLLSYLLVGGEVVLRALKNIARGQVFDENFLMAIATVGAFAIGEYPEGVAVMLFYQIGEFFQGVAVNRSRKSIAALMDIRPDFANLKDGKDVRKVSPEEVSIGDIIIVKPGEKVPLDGTVIEGKSMVDTSALTGESVPRDVKVGNEILGGFINKSGLLTIKVEKEFGESTVAKILDLVQNASSKKAPTENFITKFARYYTPVVVISAAALAFLPPLFIQGASFSDWLSRALVFLVVSCPCALVVSIPLGFFGGIGAASKSGILVKGGNYLEALNNVESVVFDKTGTLTKGVFKVTEINAIEDSLKEEVLEYAALAESYSNHPIATSIVKAYNKEIDKSEVKDYSEISGHGIHVVAKGKEVLVGNHKLMEAKEIPYEKVDATGTIVHVAIDHKYVGYIIISDEIKGDSAKAIKGLKEIGIKKTVMLTGDNKAVGTRVAKELGLDEVYAELLPQDKVSMLEKIQAEKSPKGKVIFVGDGINDAPVLAMADIGIAMGGVGSDAAIEAADVVIMTDEPSKIVSAINIAKRTNKIVKQNIIFALGVKGVILLMGAFGVATMWEAVFGDVGVALIAVLNSMRVLKAK